MSSTKLGFAKRLAEAREDKKMSQAQLAKAVGYKHQSSIGNLEAAMSGLPRADKIGKIASVLGVRADWLMYGRGERTPPPGGVSDRAMAVAILFDRQPVHIQQAIESLCGIEPTNHPMRRATDKAKA